MPEHFDITRISQARKETGFCSNTIRAFAREGLPLYSRGRMTYFSKAELERFLLNTERKPVTREAA